MERRHRERSPGYRGRPSGGSYSHRSRSRSPEDIARDREYSARGSRQDRDIWRRSVDNFLDRRDSRSRSRSPSRSPHSNRSIRSPRSMSRSMSISRSRSRSLSPARSRSRSRSPHESIWDRMRRMGHRSPDRTRNNRERRRSFEREDTFKKRRGSPGRRRVRDQGYSPPSRGGPHSEDDTRSGRAWSDASSNKSDNEFDIHNYYSTINLQGEDRYAYQRQTPQETVIIRGLAQHITEDDVRQDILACQLKCKDIRLVRRKDTGASRGFAFVEFESVADATTWIEMKDGELMLKDHFRALLQYSFPRDPFVKDRLVRGTDWLCNCQARNFRRRDFCYRCNVPRTQGEFGTFSNHALSTLLLTGLDLSTSEESVLQSLKTLSALPIRSVKIIRDPLTGVSKGFCYLEMNNVSDAMHICMSFTHYSPEIDGRTPTIGYARLKTPSAGYNAQPASTAVAAAQWSRGQEASASSSYSCSDVPRLAEYSASLYAKNPQEKAAYYKYYEEYYKKQISEGQQISLPTNSSGNADSGWAGAQAAYAATRKDSSIPRTSVLEAPDGTGRCSYLAPDISSYQYDKSSGYYYDPYTTLYYDANSQYYFNSKLSKFLYWDASKSTFLPAPSQGVPAASSSSAKEEETKKAKEPEKDKVKVAKRIAKDMEKWAKTLNQKKEIAKQNIVLAQQAAVANMKATGSADIGYAVLERKDLGAPPRTQSPLDLKSKAESLVAAYGQGSESEDEGGDEELVDWTKLACLLCKRQFPSKEVLTKHQQLSDLHKQNLAAWQRARGPEDQAKARRYRDRAKERRLKYGEPDQPQPNRLKESYMKAKEAVVSYEEPTREGIGAENLGNKLLQKMGWTEGMGLGRANQGRTSIIQTTPRAASAGLGTKSVGVTRAPGETYKDCVKKMMQIRYQELED